MSEANRVSILQINMGFNKASFSGVRGLSNLLRSVRLNCFRIPCTQKLQLPGT